MGITYYNAKFSEIPEWLFSKKVTAEYMSAFRNCKNIRSIPENLFNECRNIKNFNFTFDGCTGITSIPENLFKYNTEAESFVNTFDGCTGIINIPEKIIEVVKRAKENGGIVDEVFQGCTSASNYNSLPAYMK